MGLFDDAGRRKRTWSASFHQAVTKITHINISETVNITRVTMDIHWIVKVKDWHTI